MSAREQVFQKDSTYSLRGICMLLIVLHHFYQYTASRYGVIYPVPLTIILSSLGYLSTGIFFLLSGYGLSLSINKNEPVSFRYIMKQMVKLYKPFLLIWCVSLIIDLIFLKENAISGLLLNAVTLSLPEGGGFWFLKEIFFIYLGTLVVFSIVRNNLARQFIVLTGVLVFTVLGKMNGMGDWWLNSVICFPIGVFCYYKKDWFERNNTILCGLILISLFVVSFIGSNAVGVIFADHEFLQANSRLLLQIISAIALALYSIRFISIVNIKNQALNVIGTNSLCIYLYHLYFLSLFAFMGSVVLYLTTVILSTLILTVIYMLLDKRISISSYGIQNSSF